LKHYRMTIEFKIPLIVVTGFLGAGKTTFIKRLLREFSDGRRIGIIQNEYASANIDSEELRSTGKKFEILEINNGSVFCICLLANFIDSLVLFIDEYKPEIIILEASGLSDPIAIAELLQHEKLSGRIYLSGAWCIIDSVNYMKTGRMMDRIRRQVMISDWLILNKTDLGGENVKSIREELSYINSDAEIMEASYCNIDMDFSAQLLNDETVALKREDQHSTHIPSDRAEISTVVLKTSRPISAEGLQLFLSETEKKIIRLKGFVMLNDGSKVKIQSQFGNTSVEEISWYNGPTELIGLGYNIIPVEFGRRFHEIRQSVTAKK
jgi:G3E family GTPase